MILGLERPTSGRAEPAIAMTGFYSRFTAESQRAPRTRRTAGTNPSRKRPSTPAPFLTASSQPFPPQSLRVSASLRLCGKFVFVEIRTGDRRGLCLWIVTRPVIGPVR